MYRINIVKHNDGLVMLSLACNTPKELETKISELIDLYYEELQNEEYILVLDHII